MTLAPHSDLRRLMKRARHGERVLSVYLDLAGAARPRARVEADLRRLLGDLRPTVRPEQRASFEADALQVERVVAQHALHRGGLVVFCNRDGNYCWSQETSSRVGNMAFWRGAPHLLPLFEARDDLSGLLAAVLDRGRARLLRLAPSGVVGREELQAQESVRRVKHVGLDKIRSQANVERAAETHAARFLGRVARRLSHLAAERRFERLLVAGPVEATHELVRRLPKDPRERLIGCVALPSGAEEDRILKIAVESARRAGDLRQVRTWRELSTAARKKERAVLGAEATLEHLHAGSIRRLILAQGTRPTGSRCPACGRLSTARGGRCPACGGRAPARRDLLEPIVEAALAEGATLEVLRGRPGKRLLEAGGLGAFLRY